MISNYLKKLSEQETALHYPSSSLLEKHVDGNDLIRGLIFNVVPFYRFVRTKIMACREDEQRLEASSSHRQEPEDEHNYDATVSTPLTFAAFKRRSKSINAVIVKNVVENLKPGNYDPERLFSFARLSKNHLQTRMSHLQAHDRNVSLQKISPSVL